MKHLKKSLVIVVILSLFLSCDLDINENPNNPTTATVTELLPHGQVSVIRPFSSLVNTITSSAVQTSVNTMYDNFTVNRTTIDDIWSNLYSGGLKDLEEIIVIGTKKKQWHYVGIAKLMKAYTFSLMVDLWNDIPYSKAFNPNSKVPTYDASKTIYTHLESLIKEALIDLDKKSGISPASDDVIYSGNLNKWHRMGNTLLLKMYNQIRLVDKSVASKIKVLIAQKKLIQSNADDFQLVFGSTASPENRMQLFVNDYVFRLDNRISNYFNNLLKRNKDPRIPYYFYNQKAKTFVGRDAGNPNGLSTFEDQDTRTFHGVYPCGGQYDNGVGGKTTGDLGLKGAGTYRMITYAMRLFIEAEVGLTMGITTSASIPSLFEKAIRESMKKVNELGAGSGISKNQIDTYVTDRLAVFNTSNNTDKLKLVMMEKYVLLFGNGMEQYNDWRRTGFPNDLKLVVQTNVILNRFPYPYSIKPPTLPKNNEFVFWDK